MTLLQARTRPPKHLTKKRLIETIDNRPVRTSSNNTIKTTGRGIPIQMLKQRTARIRPKRLFYKKVYRSNPNRTVKDQNNKAVYVSVVKGSPQHQMLLASRKRGEKTYIRVNKAEGIKFGQIRRGAELRETLKAREMNRKAAQMRKIARKQQKIDQIMKKTGATSVMSPQQYKSFLTQQKRQNIINSAIREAERQSLLKQLQSPIKLSAQQQKEWNSNLRNRFIQNWVNKGVIIPPFKPIPEQQQQQQNNITNIGEGVTYDPSLLKPLPKWKQNRIQQNKFLKDKFGKYFNKFKKKGDPDGFNTNISADIYSNQYNISDIQKQEKQFEKFKQKTRNAYKYAKLAYNTSPTTLKRKDLIKFFNYLDKKYIPIEQDWQYTKQNYPVIERNEHNVGKWNYLNILKSLYPGMIYAGAEAIKGTTNFGRMVLSPYESAKYMLTTHPKTQLKDLTTEFQSKPISTATTLYVGGKAFKAGSKLNPLKYETFKSPITLPKNISFTRNRVSGKIYADAPYFKGLTWNKKPWIGKIAKHGEPHFPKWEYMPHKFKFQTQLGKPLPKWYIKYLDKDIPTIKDFINIKKTPSGNKRFMNKRAMARRGSFKRQRGKALISQKRQYVRRKKQMQPKPEPGKRYSSKEMLHIEDLPKSDIRFPKEPKKVTRMKDKTVGEFEIIKTASGKKVTTKKLKKRAGTEKNVESRPRSDVKKTQELTEDLRAVYEHGVLKSLERPDGGLRTIYKDGHRVSELRNTGEVFHRLDPIKTKKRLPSKREKLMGYEEHWTIDPKTNRPKKTIRWVETNKLGKKIKRSKIVDVHSWEYRPESKITRLPDEVTHWTGERPTLKKKQKGSMIEISSAKEKTHLRGKGKLKGINLEKGHTKQSGAKGGPNLKTFQEVSQQQRKIKVQQPDGSFKKTLETTKSYINKDKTIMKFIVKETGKKPKEYIMRLPLEDVPTGKLLTVEHKGGFRKGQKVKLIKKAKEKVESASAKKNRQKLVQKEKLKLEKQTNKYFKNIFDDYRNKQRHGTQLELDKVNFNKWLKKQRKQQLKYKKQKIQPKSDEQIINDLKQRKAELSNRAVKGHITRKHRSEMKKINEQLINLENKIKNKPKTEPVTRLKNNIKNRTKIRNAILSINKNIVKTQNELKLINKTKLNLKNITQLKNINKLKLNNILKLNLLQKQKLNLVNRYKITTDKYFQYEPKTPYTPPYIPPYIPPPDEPIIPTIPIKTNTKPTTGYIKNKKKSYAWVFITEHGDESPIYKSQRDVKREAVNYQKQTGIKVVEIKPVTDKTALAMKKALLWGQTGIRAKTVGKRHNRPKNRFNQKSMNWMKIKQMYN